jgi:cytochrome o ubiquinol oxidase subunit 2
MIAWRYRAGNERARYTPDWDGNRGLELTWWGIPLAIISVLAVITWQSSHQLDPSRPLASSQSPLTVQVVALDWKWLFIYPDQHLATVNYVRLPVGRPINFQITADAPMNSFWIPQLGGQMYAMAGMSTQLHLMASQAGNYAGSSANISGRGFAGMRFTAQAVAPADFDTWVAASQHGAGHLTTSAYRNLARPSQDNPVATYAAVQPGLYDAIIMDYMMPMPGGDIALGAAQ